MPEKYRNPHDTYAFAARTGYVICGLVVLTVGSFVFTRASSEDAEKHMIPHEISADDFFVHYPMGWDFMKNAKNSRQTLQLTIPDEQNFTEKISRVAENMELARELAAERRAESPLLTIHRKRMARQSKASSPNDTASTTFQTQPRVPRPSQENPYAYGAAHPPLEELPPTPPALLPGATTGNIGENAGNTGNLPSLEDVLNDESEAEVLPLELPPELPPEGTLEETPTPAKTPMKKAPATLSARDARSIELLQKFHKHAQARMTELSSEIHDYSCILYKWDQTNLPSRQMDVMDMKIREEPFSIYAKFYHPNKVQGREWILWENHYDGKLLVNSGPKMFSRTLLVGLDSPAVHSCATHSIQELGFRRLLKMLADISRDASKFAGAHVLYYENARVGNRPCYALEVNFAKKTEEIDFNKLEIFIDKELEIPIRLTLYEFAGPENKLAMKESYTYIITGTNLGMTDYDFCHLNPSYQFQRTIRGLSDRERTFLESLAR